jgi:hypothetical protein
MDTLPYSTLNLTSEEVTSILSIFNSLQSIYKVNFKMEFTFTFEGFSLFETYQDYSIGPVIEVKSHENLFNITFTEITYRTNTASRLPVQPTTEYQTWCMLPLKRQYGHILIKTETIFDKIHELIHPIEIDFKDDVDFNHQFYLLASDEIIARSLLSPQFRSSLKLLRQKDLWIEVSKDKLILGNKKRIDTSNTLEMADFLYKISVLLS